MNKILKAALTVWYLVLTMVFLFATMLSAIVLFGIFDNTYSELSMWVGLLGCVVFWCASSKYREKFISRVEETQKNSNKDWDNDELD